MHRRLALAALLFTVPAPCFSSEPADVSGDEKTIAVARAYLDAYLDFDLDTMATLYAAEARFVDPTSMKLPGLEVPFVWNGREEIVKALRPLAANWSDASFDIERIYESSGHVVFIGTIAFTPAGGERPATLSGHIVTIVAVEDGKVVEHRDYFDYAGLRRPQASDTE